MIISYGLTLIQYDTVYLSLSDISNVDRPSQQKKKALRVNHKNYVQIKQTSYSKRTLHEYGVTESD